jgi:hypothetical protein
MHFLNGVPGVEVLFYQLFVLFPQGLQLVMSVLLIYEAQHPVRRPVDNPQLVEVHAITH